MLNRGLDKSELLRIVEAVANEKSIDKELVIGSMESAIQKAALTKFGNDNNIEVIIDRESGDIKIQKVLDIVEKVEDPAREISLENAKKNDPKNKELKVGEKIFEELPQIDFGRIAAQSAKQVISSRVREAEKNRQYEDFIDKQGQILSGIIKRLEYGNVIVDLGKAEGVIKKDELIPREILKTGDRVKAYCYEVKKELKGHQIFLSRAHPQFLAKLFFQEVPEIYEGTIEIKSVARDPGSRAKICVHSQDSSIDPVGACVGMRGSRVQTIVNELHGEKIDIIKWTEDLPTLISESLSPAEIPRFRAVPAFSSRTARTRLREEITSRDCGIVFSSIRAIVPSRSMNSISSGRNVFAIHIVSTRSRRCRNNMPSLSAISRRNIRPRDFCSLVSASSTLNSKTSPRLATIERVSRSNSTSCCADSGSGLDRISSPTTSIGENMETTIFNIFIYMSIYPHSSHKYYRRPTRGL